MSDVKFHSDGYWRPRYNLRDSMIDEGRPNHPIEGGSISLSVLKGYSLFCNH